MNNDAGKIFVKTCLKAVRDTFFSQYVEFPNMWYFYPTEVPSFSGIFWSPHEENPEGGWSAYCNDFLSKKKFTACKIKDEKEEITFYFLMVFNLLKIIHPFESKKHLRT